MTEECGVGAVLHHGQKTRRSPMWSPRPLALPIRRRCCGLNWRENHNFEYNGDLRSRTMPDPPDEEESADSDAQPRDPERAGRDSTSD
jgi:hypothetical protein